VTRRTDNVRHEEGLVIEGDEAWLPEEWAVERARRDAQRQINAERRRRRSEQSHREKR
jgi:hypothetical protein